MKIESYEAMDVELSRTEIIRIVFDYLKYRSDKPLNDQWTVADHHGTLDRLTLILQRNISSVDTESK